MANKTEIVANIKKLLEKDKLILGTNVTIKELKNGTLSKVFLTSNTPKKVEEEIKHYSDIAKVDVEKVSISNEEFGIICKKSFLVSVAGEKK